SFVTDPATPEIYTLSLHDALPIWSADPQLRRRRHPRHQHPRPGGRTGRRPGRIALGEVKFNRRCPMAKKWNSRLALVNQPTGDRSEEHTSELQSRENLVCRLLLEK